MNKISIIFLMYVLFWTVELHEQTGQSYRKWIDICNLREKQDGVIGKGINDIIYYSQI